MDALALSRIQFAVTAGFHFIFVPLTLGLSLLVAWMEVQWVRTGDEVYLRMTRFWGRLFVVNFVMGVVTGLTLAFQFGMNWSTYARYVGDVFGVPLAVEAKAAFFLEAVFLGLWIFGWRRVSPRVHAFAMVMVAFAVNLSALWILLANGWMQHPVGYVVRNDRAELVDFLAFFTNGYGWLKFLHTVAAGYVVAAFFVLAISSWHLLKGSHRDFFRRSFRMAAVFGLVSALAVIVIGDFHGAEVGKVQPAKLAAMESLWETERGVPFYLLLIPDPRNERNVVEFLGIPKMVSFLAYRDFHAEVQGLKAFPKEERPPVWETFIGFRTMVGLGFLLLVLAGAAFWVSRRGLWERYPLLLKILIFSLPLPYLACQLGWLVAEAGRQPWVVYGVLRTAQAVSPTISTQEVALSLTGFTILYLALTGTNFFLLARHAAAGPEAERGER
ncbi:MAG: cytochrome ubiquinol oxidase subunit I [Syntrophales bacterium]|nr:cytochrome ubiquinol oxidase subunit I [Syntrophales bacterium]